MSAAAPLRMCVVCRKRFPKPFLLRHVMRPGTEGNGLVPDEAGTLPGRGWYLCHDEQCMSRFARMKFRSKARNGSKAHG